MQQSPLNICPATGAGKNKRQCQPASSSPSQSELVSTSPSSSPPSSSPPSSSPPSSSPPSSTPPSSTTTSLPPLTTTSTSCTQMTTTVVCNRSGGNSACNTTSVCGNSFPPSSTQTYSPSSTTTSNEVVSTSLTLRYLPIGTPSCLPEADLGFDDVSANAAINDFCAKDVTVYARYPNMDPFMLYHDTGNGPNYAINITLS
ncbi:uncharacterized protein LY89DRAFT_787342 [Mollisia scopiformis]|uniref:Uncharacterized protein n=1 Tax=Mollisia scopiformis TaxID=149040 RepID=A0A132BEJ9_MOLSC|nr:uncharacterized protein LY89DRAFT_787342 [Mollisia scopiformis]KUJ10274.1 hypothetical protein LY89DRAFT_787342 [Mollisia scopiformis]